MKKNILAFSFICLILLSSITVYAKDIVRPPENLKSLIGKLLTIENVYGPGTFYCHVTGVSEYIASMGKEVSLSVDGLSYNGEKIDVISYVLSSSPSEEKWQLLSGGHPTKVRLLSIE